MTLLLVVSAVLILSSFTASGFALIERFNQTNQRRAEVARIDARQTQTLVNLLCFVRDFPADHRLTPQELVRLDKFYSGALQSIGADPTACARPIK